jgi:hypothetical protein
MGAETWFARLLTDPNGVSQPDVPRGARDDGFPFC